MDKIIRRFVSAALLIYCLFILAYVLRKQDSYMWDFKAYYYSVKAFISGINPYDTYAVSNKFPLPGGLMSYAMQPVTLLFFMPFALLDVGIAYYLYAVFKFSLLISLIYIWRREFLSEKNNTLFYTFCIFAFNSCLYTDIAAGNICMLEQVFLWSAFAFYLHNRLLQFCILVVVAALFKNTPLLFLFMLIASDNKNRYGYFIWSIISYVTITSVSFLLFPELFMGFLNNAYMGLKSPGESGLINPATLTFIKTIFLTLGRKTGIWVSQYIQVALFLFIDVVIVSITWYMYIKFGVSEMKERKKILLFLSCIVYALILPRFKDYAYILLLAPAYYIIEHSGAVKSYVPLLILTILPLGSRLMGFMSIAGILSNYYPLLIAYLIWALYLYKIYTHGLCNSPTTEHSS